MGLIYQAVDVKRYTWHLPVCVFIYVCVCFRLVPITVHAAFDKVSITFL